MKIEQVGSVELTSAILAKRPGIVICGHVHSGFGRYDCEDIAVYNVSVVDEGYSLVNAPTLIESKRSV
jgi:Icc-related predicted phosphoesterase